MKITGLRSRLVEFPLSAPFRPAWGRGRVQTTLMLVLFEVYTDDGITGLGAANGGLEAAVAVDRFVTPHLLGQDPTHIEALTTVLRDAEILGPPVYGMEVPLWDIVGKAAGLPIYRLWGAATDRVPAYASTGELRGPGRRADDVRRLMEEGFRAVKLRFHQDDPLEDMKVVEAVRAAVGDRVALMVDANQAGADPGIGGHVTWDWRLALAVAKELERLDVTWLEEPLPRHDHDGLARLRQRVDRVRIAGGEDNHGIHEFKLLLERGCFDILQPDAFKSETASKIRKLAASAEAAGVDVVPHTWGNGVALLVHLHLAASLPNCGWVEFPHDPPSGLSAGARDQMLAEPIAIDPDGSVGLPQHPGFGFAFDEERVARHTVQVIERGTRGGPPA